MKPLYTEIIRRFVVLSILALFAYLVVDDHIAILYVFPLLALSLYITIPFSKIPKGAAHFTRANAVYVPDFLVAFFWLMGWLLFFFILKEESTHAAIAYFCLIFFGIIALAIACFTTIYAINWYHFQDGELCFSDAKGIECHKIEDIAAIYEYKRALPKWIAIPIFLFGEKNVQSNSWTLIAATSAPEMGIIIEFHNGRKLKILANHLNGDTKFAQQIRELYKTSKK